MKNNRPEVVKFLLSRSDVDPNLGDNWGRTPLFKSIADQNLDLILLII